MPLWESRLVVALTLLLGAAPASAGEPRFRAVQSTAAHELVVREGDFDANTKISARPSIARKIAPQTADFTVTYNGFPPQAQAAFQEAVDIWSRLITSPVTIRVQANWASLGPGILGSARSNSFWTDGVDVFPDALADALTGTDLGMGNFDILANFNSDNPSWYLGTDGDPPSGQFDLVTVVLHEIAHGLGFFGSLFVDDAGFGFWGFAPPGQPAIPAIYDEFSEGAAGDRLLNTALFPNPSTALGDALQSGAVFFDGPRARAANGGQRPELFAPSAWIDGSSYSHLDESTYPAGDADSLMTPLIRPAEAIHDPGPIALCMFQDMGWTTAEDCLETGGICVNSTTRVCLQDGRFAVDVEWRGLEPPYDTPSPAFVSDLRTDDSGIFFFSDPANLELLIKVLDACESPFESFWVFFAATTDVEFTVTVTDTQTGEEQEYFNALGQPANAVTDTSAFMTCP